MTKKRKWIVSILLAVLSVSCSLVGIACKDTEEVSAKLVDFTDATVYTDYKSDFSINPYLTAIDDQGGVHKGTASVVDGKGNEIELFANRFKITSVENYTATVSVSLNETTYTRTLTIDVLDKTAPVISVSPFTAQKGEECAPSITVNKIEVEEITPNVKVYAIQGDQATELVVNDGKFTPKNEGSHKMVITAEDQYGTISTLEYDFYVRSYINVLQSFDIESSVNDVRESKTGSNYDTVAGGFYSVWHETYQGRTGVVETVTTSGGVYGMAKVAVRFNRRVEELAAMEFDYISIWLWIDGEAGQTYQINAQNLVLEKEIQADTWQEVRIYKEDIENTKAYWHNHKSSNTTARDKFNSTHAQDGTGDYLFNIKLPQATDANDLTTQADALKIYMDSISYANIEVGSYQVPTSTGTKFTLPTAKLLDETTALLTDEYQVKAEILGVGELDITNNQIDVLDGGDYVVTYSFTYGGRTYTEQLTFTVARLLSEGVLEDFAAPSSSTNLRNGERGLSSTTVSSWTAEKADSNNVTKTGVARLALGAGKALYFNSPRTRDEMKAMTDWDYLSIMVLVERDSVAVNTTGTFYQFSNCAKEYKNKVWTEIRFTKDEINGLATNANGAIVTEWSKKVPNYANQGCSTGVDVFCLRHHKGGTGYYLFSIHSSVSNTVIYVDEVKFVKNA